MSTTKQYSTVVQAVLDIHTIVKDMYKEDMLNAYDGEYHNATLKSEYGDEMTFIPDQTYYQIRNEHGENVLIVSTSNKTGSMFMFEKGHCYRIDPESEKLIVDSAVVDIEDKDIRFQMDLYYGFEQYRNDLVEGLIIMVAPRFQKSIFNMLKKLKEAYAGGQ